MAKYFKTGLPPGPKAKSGGTPVTRNEKRGKGMQFVLYMRKGTKDVIRKAADASNQRMSGYIKWKVLEAIAKERECSVKDLIPKSEFDELLRTRGRSVGNWEAV
jgi:hypothetical protein